MRLGGGRTLRKGFILSAVGRDRPGVVADLAQLVFDCDANLEDSRMALLGNEFASILLCSGTSEDLGERLATGARRLEWENRLTILLRPLEGEPRPPVPAPGYRLFEIRAQGEDRAGIVARICRTLADLNRGGSRDRSRGRVVGRSSRPYANPPTVCARAWV